MNIKKLFLPLFLVLGTITSFAVSIIKPDFTSSKISSQSNFDSQEDFTQEKNNSTLQNSSAMQNQLQKLSVLPLRCIGCGKCARIDSSHFEMNPNTGKAFVISSTNLDSQNLSIAINTCPANAITLE